MEFRVEIEPMGAVRMTGRGKWVKPNAQRYLTYKKAIQSAISEQVIVNHREPTKNPVAVYITFFMPIPNSWSKRKKKLAPSVRHTKKPDIDNMVKGLFDSLNGIIWKDDNQVVICQAEKVYHHSPGIEFDVEEL